MSKNRKSLAILPTPLACVTEIDRLDSAFRTKFKRAPLSQLYFYTYGPNSKPIYGITLVSENEEEKSFFEENINTKLTVS